MSRDVGRERDAVPDSGPDADTGGGRDAGPDSRPSGDEGAAGDRRDPLAPHRDDGVLAALPRPGGGRGHPVPEVVLLAVAVVAALGPPLAAALLGTPDVLGLPVWGWVAVGLGLACLGRLGRRLARLDWPVPALLRALEYGGLLALTGGGPTTYVLLSVLAFRHYDIVYRVRTLGVPSPRWLDLAAGGWPVRLLVLVAAAAAGVLEVAVVIVAAVLAAIVLPESLTRWLVRSPQPG